MITLGPSPATVALRVAADGVGVAALVVAGRWRRSAGVDLVRRRWAFILAARRRGWRLSQIGAKLGGRNHTTIGYGFIAAQALIETDAEFAALAARVADAWAEAAQAHTAENSGG